MRQTARCFHLLLRGSIVGACLLAVPARADWNVLEEAHEIVNVSSVSVDPSLPVLTYKSADDPATPGDTEVPDSLWPDYVPPAPYIKNTTRNLQFNESEFLASPGAPLGVTTYVATSDGYTWASLSQAINAMWPYNAANYSGQAAVNAYYAGNLITTPGPGVVKVTANYKGQNMKFWANENGVAPGTPGAVPLDRYFVTDEWGNVYIMHASGQLDQSQVGAAFVAAVLPDGWTKQTLQLSDDLILNPAAGSDGTFHYALFRDSADNTYHQISWSSTGITLESQVAGMPIWGGTTDDILYGRASDDNLIHGAQGNDTIHVIGWNDTIYGDDGVDTVVLGGDYTDYLLQNYADNGASIVLSGFGHTKTLYDVEFLQFNDGTFATSAIPEPAHFGLILLTGTIWILRRRKVA